MLAAPHSWTLVSAPRLSSTLPNDACRRRFSSGDGSRVSRVGFGPAFPSQDGWRGMMVAPKGGAVVAPVAHTSRHRLVDVVAVIMNHVAEGHSA